MTPQGQAAKAAWDRHPVTAPAWRKSSHSGYNGNCLEAAPTPSALVNNGACAEVTGWRASSRCDIGNCAEAASGPGGVLVRDTRQDGTAARTVLAFPAGAWREFTARLREIAGVAP